MCMCVGFMYTVHSSQVPGMELHTGEEITMLSASDAATACFTSDRRIFLCYDYNVRVIALADQ